MIEIIPAIDIIDGKCVRLKQGDFETKTIYSDSPADVAKSFEDIGISRLHLVDLDGAKTGKIVNIKALRAISNATELVIDFGGGIKTEEDVRNVFDAGASFISIGSIAVKEPEKVAGWINIFGGDKIMIGADARGEEIYIDGWQTQTSHKLLPFINNYITQGITQVFVTDIERDGLLNGPSLNTYRKIVNQIPGVDLIASGGVSDIDDIYKLEELGCSGVIVGKALYENKISVDEIKEFLKRNAR